MVRDINASFNLNPKDSNYANDLVTLAKHAEAAERYSAFLTILVYLGLPWSVGSVCSILQSGFCCVLGCLV
jgi:hypothetical protein